MNIKQFILFTSNRLEILAEKLALVLRTPLKSPFDKEIIVVQSKGMERWISMEVARHNRICANIGFLFPNAFIDEISKRFFPKLPEQSPFDRKIMTWKIMKILPSCIKDPVFKSLRNYLEGTGKDIKLFQLSERIAETFDQYLIFRPEMILRWEKGQEDHWQAALWRRLSQGDEKKHRPALTKFLFKELEKSSETAGDKLPERISVFGISALPMYHMQVFDFISHFAEVDLFLMNPCEGYWGDILSNREIKRAVKKQGRENAVQVTEQEQLHIDQGNSLLASMGTLGRDFFDMIYDFTTDEDQDFFDPEESDILSCIQSDIMNLRERGSESEGKTIVQENDSSARIHSCHSPMREIEVLHDNLLEMFQNNPELRPGDILVMMPDIEPYAPFIQAVFDIHPEDSKRIPFSIADRGFRMESRIIDTFLVILDLFGGRFGAAQILAILESPAVYRKFDLTEANLDLIRRWVRETRIRWGIDGQNRKNLGLPGMPENTWKTGIERLVLGYAMAGQGENMFAGVLPYDSIEGDETLVMGKFAEFTDRLFSFVKSLARVQTLGEWSDTLKNLLGGLFEPDEDTENEIQIIRNMLNDLENVQNLSDFNEKVDIKVIRRHLNNDLQKQGFGFGFITGSVTFCAMLPMRSIPFKIICLAGMNSDAYPRQSRPSGFDLIARNPKPGDRSRRNDDRYLFLEAVMSAREKLYISYVGQSIQDNSIIPPSVLVSELTDYIENGFEIPGKNILEDHIIVKHRLQAFNPEYFRQAVSIRQPVLFSYSEENKQAAQCLLKHREAPVPFITKGIAAPEEEWKTVDLEELCLFYNNPTRYLLNRRLGVYIEENGSVLEEKEPFELRGLDRYFIEQNLVEKKLDGNKLEGFLAAKKASGELPHGTVGECVYEGFCRQIEKFSKKIKPYIQKKPMKPYETELNISGFKLTGKIGAIYPERLVRYRYAKVKPKDHLKIWIHHLVLNCRNGSSAALADDYPRTSIIAGSDSIWEHDPVENSEEVLRKLLEIYWGGLAKPLHFFPESSWEYANRVRNNKPEEDALRNSQNTWQGNSYKRAEIDDLYFNLCFKHTDPLDSEFKEIALEIYEPIMENIKEVKI
ncbi:MAG: exodeoxyribonuclease V subunit gamma [Desulfobacteraceae bacterium]|nr:exodeoxyribonuclease V subunit gamma [Desulfobacteraceae bacterium]